MSRCSSIVGYPRGGSALHLTILSVDRASDEASKAGTATSSALEAILAYPL